MNILVVSQYFWPENFRINDLCLELKRRGHDVTVLTGKPNYPSGEFFDDYIDNPELFEDYKGISIYRTPMLPRKKGAINLLLNYLSFCFVGSIYSFYKLPDKEYDVIFVCQLSPITSAIPAIFYKKRKNIPIFMWSLDLWPDSLEAVGVIKNKRALKMVSILVSWVYKNCDVILGQSKSYLDAIKRYDKSNTKLMLFPNWAEEQFKLTRLTNNNSNCLRILFAGNVGEAQDFESILNCAKLIKNNDVKAKFIIVGDGRKLKWLEGEIIKYELNEYFILKGQHPLAAMPDFYSNADVALVSLKSNDIFSRTIPGKIQSYMLASLPILGMLDGEGKKLIEKSNCGLSCSASDVESFFENIKKMSSMTYTERQKLGDNGRKFADNYFNKDKIISDLECAMLDYTVN